MANGCEFNYGDSLTHGVATTTSNGLCKALASFGEIAPGCFQVKPSNDCPVAKYYRGEITLEEAKEMLKMK